MDYATTFAVWAGLVAGVSSVIGYRRGYAKASRERPATAEVVVRREDAEGHLIDKMSARSQPVSVGAELTVIHADGQRTVVTFERISGRALPPIAVIATDGLSARDAARVIKANPELLR